VLVSEVINVSVSDGPVSKVSRLMLHRFITLLSLQDTLNCNKLSRCHRRFGYGSDFAKLASSEEEEQADYVLGVSSKRRKASVKSSFLS